MLITGSRSFSDIPKFGSDSFVRPTSFSLVDLEIRTPSVFSTNSFAGDGKNIKTSYGNPALAKQPAPNVIILIDDKTDLAAINGSYVTAPHRTLVIVAHGGPSGVERGHGKGNYSATQLADVIKQKVGDKLNQYDQIVFVSCRMALAGNLRQLPNGTYTQTVANALGKPVYAATEFGFINSAGKLTIAGSTSPTVGARQKDTQDLGRFIRFDPGGNPKNSSALQLALKEHRRANESELGAGKAYDDEFSGKNQAGTCINATVAQCIGK